MSQLTFSVASTDRRGLLFMSAYYWVDKMDHAVSSLILSQFLSLSLFFFLDPLRPEAPGSLETCHVTFGRQCSCRRSKRGGGAAWKCRKTAPHTSSSSSSSASPASLWVMSLGLAAPVRRLRTHNWRRRGRRSAHLLWGQSSKTPTKRSSPGWRSPDTQTRKAPAELQVCVTRRAKGPFHFQPPQRDVSLCFCSEIQKAKEKIWSGWLANKPV